MSDYGALVDLERKTVSPRVFVDEDIYRAEQDKIFGRSWLFVAHESQLANSGDFVSTTMGEEPVMAVRGKDGEIRVFLNSCRHRGSRVCRVDSGNTRMFSCPYHGWSYDTEGALRGVPQMSTAYHDELDKSQWGLVKVPRVEHFCGLVFASFDPEIEPLIDALADIAWYLELIFKRSKNGCVALPGVHRWHLPGNWKFAAEQFAGDNYHTGALHQSMVKIGLGPSEFQGQRPWDIDFQVKSRGGHGWINFGVPTGAIPPAVEKFVAKVSKEAETTLSPEQARLVHCVQVGNVFPNFAVIAFMGFITIRVWQPRGLRDIDVWSYALIERDAPPEVVEFARKTQTLTFSSSGIFEQDDGCVWGEAMSALAGMQRRKTPLNYQMGAGHERKMDDKPGWIHPPSTEIGIFGFHEAWREKMLR